MKIAHTISNTADTSRPKRRFYSAELKAQVIQECRQSGASTAGVALAHGINANIVHRWLNEDRNAALLAQAKAFTPIALDRAAAAPAIVDAPAQSADIRVDIRHGNSAITVNWPLAGAASCAAWLRDWLR